MNIKRIFKRKPKAQTRDLQELLKEFEVVKVPINRKFSAKNNYELLRKGKRTGVFAVDKEVLEAHVPELAGLVVAQMKDEAESYGHFLAFYACGHDWKKQLEFRKHYEDLGINLL